MANEADADSLRSFKASREGHARHARNNPTLNAVAVNTVAADVLAAAASAADAGGAAHDFRHEPENISGPRQMVAVAAVVTEDYVVRLKVGRDGDAGKLLPNAGLCRRACLQRRVSEGGFRSPGSETPESTGVIGFRKHCRFIRPDFSRYEAHCNLTISLRFGGQAPYPNAPLRDELPRSRPGA